MDEGRDLDAVALIDVASEDDLLICSSTGGPEPSSGHYKSCRSPLEKPSKVCIQVEQVPMPSDSPEIKHNSSDKYNLRKSLAWDNAFFTSEGVLDPEELAVVNSTFRKVQIHVLPGIQEDARKSGESSTTLDSDSWAAENAEDDLFENLRASIQNFQAKRGKIPSLLQSSTTSLLQSSTTLKREKLDVTASKNEQISSQVKVKPPFVPKKKQGLTGQRLVEKTTSASHLRVTNAPGGSREERPSPRLPRTACGLQAAPSRGPSVSRSVHIKSKTEGNGQPATASKRHIAGDQYNVTPRSSPSVKSAGSAKLHSSAACSSNGGSGGFLYDRIGKAPLESTRKKASSANSDHSSSKSAHIYPVRASKDIHRTRNASVTLKFSSSLSPSSSIESFASESSSSSTSTARNPTNSTGALDHSLGVTAYNAPHDNSAAQSLKPSGLRLPSPKIGYFDAEKSLPRSANKSSQRCQVSLIQNASKLNNNDGPVQQEKSCKDQLATSVDSSPHYLELTNPPTTGSPSPSLLQAKSCSEISDNVRKSQNHCKKCPNSQETSCNSRKITLKANNVVMETPSSISGLGTEEGKYQDQFQSLLKRTAITGDELVVSGDGTEEVREIAGEALEELSSSILHIQDGFMENKRHTISSHGDKENILPSEDQMSATNHT